MIEEMRITGLGVIDESVLELGPGLTVITGETGAGKTMLVTALGLLLGGRADSGAVRKDASAARVEGVITPTDAIRELVAERGGWVEDDQLVIARQVSAEGRSRAFVGGASVPVAALGEVGDQLVAVHGQSDQHRLLRPEAALSALDAFGGPKVLSLRESFARDHARLKEIESELRAELAGAREQAREAEMLRHGVEEIEAVAPRAGEDAELAAEETRLGASDTLRTAAESAREALSSEAGGPDANAAVAAARRALDSVADVDAEAGALAKRIAELSYLLSDLAADVASYAMAVETDPARLAAVSERRAELTALTRKYGEDIAEVLAWSADAQERLTRFAGSDDRIAALREERTTLRAAMAQTAAALSKKRRTLAGKLGATVTDEIRQLSMAHATLEFVVSQREIEPDSHLGLVLDDTAYAFTETGIDSVEIMFAANTGAGARPLAKGASGGELSRVMLGLEVVLAATHPVPTMVFDEVDAGVGGRAAVEIGRRLGVLAQSTQVLVVTHLPQVAAFADAHVVVRKSSDGSVTTSGLEHLDDAARVKELARMLAGLEDSDRGQAHAEELLAMAQEARRQ